MKSDGRFFSIREVCAFLVEKIVWIIVIAVICAILLPTAKYLKNEKNSNSAEVQTYTLSDSEYRVVKLCWEYEEEFQNVSDYVENSSYMKLNPFSINQAVLTLKVDATDEKIIEKYSTIIKNYINNHSYNKIESSLTTDLVSVDSNVDAGVVSIIVYGLDEQNAKENASIIRTDLMDYIENINRDQTISISETSYDETTVVDNDVQKKQLEILGQYNALRANVDNLRGLMNANQITAYDNHTRDIQLSGGDLSNDRISKKYILAGGLLGVVAAVAFIFLYYIWSAIIFMNRDVEEYGLRDFGTIHLTVNNKFTTRIAAKIRNGKDDSREASMLDRINRVSSEGYVLIGSKSDEVSSKMFDKCNYAENVAEALDKGLFREKNKVILTIQLRKDNWNKLAKEIRDCKDLDVEVLGTIFVD